MANSERRATVREACMRQGCVRMDGCGCDLTPTEVMRELID